MASFGLRAKSGVLSLALLAIAFLAVFTLLATPASHPTSTSTVASGYVVTSDPSALFPNGYLSRAVNFSEIRSGDSISVGGTPFRYEVPSNLETRTTSTGGTTTTIVVTAEYQCGTSIGARMFFHARLENGTEFKLDYCLVLNTAIAQGAYQGSTPRNWSLTQVSKGTAPIVAIHMEGAGEYVRTAVLWVERASGATMRGTLFVSDAGRSHGGFEYTATWNATLAMTDSAGDLKVVLETGLGDALTSHEFAVTGFSKNSTAVSMLVDGHQVAMRWTANDTIWNGTYDQYYIASWGGDAPPSEHIGLISPGTFPGLSPGWYVELRLK